MSPYIHELAGWPMFAWDHERLASPLAAARHLQGRLLGQMEALGFTLKEEAVLRTLTDDVLKSSEIEGETLDADQVRSSVARRLGMDIGGLKPADRHVEGVVEMMLDATQRYDQPLTQARLFDWHASLFPTGRSGMHRITVGAWRDDRTAAMQVVSGPVGRERVHFEAPAAARLERRDAAVPRLVQPRHDDGTGAEGSAGASLVRDDSPVRRRQRPHRASHRRHGPRPIGAKSAALLQHVGADPRRARRLLPHPRADATRHAGRHGVDGVVPRVPHARDRGSSDYPRQTSSPRRAPGRSCATSR